MYDVIIIGAGVTGSYAAGELARLGYHVCVLEKQEQPGLKTSCTGIISLECFEMLSIDHSLIQNQARSARIFAPSGKYLRIEREGAQAYILDRPGLDRLMARKAQQKGAEFHFSTPVTAIRRENRHVTVEATAIQSETALFRARCVIIACGAAGGLAQSAGLGRIREFAHGAQAQVECTDVSEVEIYSGLTTAPGFFAWLVPAGGKQGKAGLLCRGNPRPYLTALLDRLLKQNRITSITSDIRYGSIPLKPLSRTYSDRLLVIGDAAGQVKPTSGGGIYFGILCAQQAVLILDECLKSGELSSDRLSLYQKRWHKLLKRELSIDYWAYRFYQGLDDKQVDHIFNIIVKHGIHESLLTSPDITFDWHSMVILDAIRHRSLQKSLEKLKAAPLRFLEARIRPRG
ncbi:MAG: geranylgeranyl reductase family protein [Chloroflexi bacterium]|nr:geranylgeranyl reductase family protein [Chloroflexota bacterium]